MTNRNRWATRLLHHCVRTALVSAAADPTLPPAVRSRLAGSVITPGVEPVSARQRAL